MPRVRICAGGTRRGVSQPRSRRLRRCRIERLKYRASSPTLKKIRREDRFPVHNRLGELVP